MLAKLSAEEQRRIADEERRARAAAQRDAEEPGREDARTVPERQRSDYAPVIAQRSGRQGAGFRPPQLGKPYRYAASGPNAYDCSGLTGAAWRPVGVSLPRTSSAQYQRRPLRRQVRSAPGDLVFFYSPHQPRRALRRQRHDHSCATPGQVGRVHQDALTCRTRVPAGPADPDRSDCSAGSTRSWRGLPPLARAVASAGCSPSAASRPAPTPMAPRHRLPWPSGGRGAGRGRRSGRPVGVRALVSLAIRPSSLGRGSFHQSDHSSADQLDFLAEPADRPVSADRQAMLGPDAWVHPVVVTRRLTGEDGRRSTGSGSPSWSMAGARSWPGRSTARRRRRTQQPLWWLGPVTARVEGDRGGRRRRQPTAGLTLVGRVGEERPRRLPDPVAEGWDGRVSLEVPADRAGLRVGARPAGRALCGDRRGDPAGRLGCRPLRRGSWSTRGPASSRPTKARELLRHETVHVATRSPESPAPRGSRKAWPSG